MTRARKPAPGHSRLFTEPEHRAPQTLDAYTAHIDGAARGNPGPASYGVAFLRPDGQPLEQLRKYIGRMTNNVAEYYALIAALDYAAAHGFKKLRIRSDSELLVRQMKGIYKVKSGDLKPLHERAKKLAATLEYFDVQHVPREQNAVADALANEALDNPGGGSTEKPARLTLAPAQTTRRIRARYRNGALHLTEPLDFPEGAEVELTVSTREIK
jgi:ribonuclease HI